MNNVVLIYDGFCVLCNGMTNFLLKIDKKQRIKISALDSKFVCELKQQNNSFPSDIDSVILFKNNKFYSRMEAVIEIGKTLKGIWYLAYILKALPRKWRNQLYDFIAKNRYRWFGKHDSCQIPDAHYKDRNLR